MFPAFGSENASDGVQVQWIAHQLIQGVGGDRHHLAPADGSGGALNGELLWPFLVDLEEVCRHLFPQSNALGAHRML